MKLHLIILMVSLSASWGAPALPHAVNWTGVTDKVLKLRAGIPEMMSDVVRVATQDNADIGASISAKFATVSSRFTEILDLTNEPIQNQNLTLNDSQAIFATFNSLIADIHDNLIADDIAALSDAARWIVNDFFDGSSTIAFYIQKHLYDIVGETERAPIWNDGVQAIGFLTLRLLEGDVAIQQVVYPENANVSNAIGAKMEKALGEAAALLYSMQTAMGPEYESLTIYEAVRFFIEIQNQMLRLQRDIVENDLPQLTEATQETVIQILELGNTEIRGYAVDVYRVVYSMN